jgi:hypothetical protein
MIDIGVIISLLSSIVALIGVYLFNQSKDAEGARVVWFWSNSGFVLYFAGRCLGFWDGGLGDLVMLVYFFLMWASNVGGMMGGKDPLPEE